MARVCPLTDRRRKRPTVSGWPHRRCVCQSPQAGIDHQATVILVDAIAQEPGIVALFSLFTGPRP